MGEFAIDDIDLSVQEPVGHFVLQRVGDDGHNLLDLLLSAFTGTLGKINIGLLQDNVGVATTHTLDGGHGDTNLAFTIDVRIHDTKNVLKLFWDDERHFATEFRKSYF